MIQIELGFWKLAFALATVSLFFAQPHHAQNLHKISSPQIGVRNAHAIVYEGIRDRVILFGGADDSRVCGDTWEWNGRRWNRISISGPGPRTFPSMAYDSIRRKVILFGGNRVLFGASEGENKFPDDTWEWDGRHWIEKKVPGPPGRAEAAMAYDSKRGRVVLFGGYHRSNGQINRLGDTWEWDGFNWTESKVTGPTPRSAAALAYDVSRGRIILFGGRTQDGLSGETWEWDGRQWTQNRTAVAEGRFNCVLAYDETTRKVIRFGGRYSGKPVGDSWEYDGQHWKRLNSNGPTPRNHTAMAYNPKVKKIILFGGHDFGMSTVTHVLGDTWEWDWRGWVLKNIGETKTRVENGH